jgi:hypothetical protein
MIPSVKSIPNVPSGQKQIDLPSLHTQTSHKSIQFPHPSSPEHNEPFHSVDAAEILGVPCLYQDE